MKLEDLPLIEQSAINMLLEGDDARQVALRHQLAAVRAVHRTANSAGIYAVFELDENTKRLEGRPSFHVADVFARSERCEEIGFILFIKEGVIEYLEGYTYGDTYPSYKECDYALYRVRNGE